MILTVAAALAFQGCSDWDDHYDGGSTGESSGANTTLWEEIESREDLSNFAKLLKKVGYDTALASDQSYTVWAPTNTAFDFEKYNAMSDSLLKAEFINNHIARGYHRAIGTVSERVYLLNKKFMTFEGTGTYSIGGIDVTTPNMLGKNGIMHIMGNKIIDFRPNFYDFFIREHENGFATTTLAQIFTSNQSREIDLDNSVVGPMKDGQITYLDTVYVEKNKIFDQLNAKLSSEDSSYTALIPSDHAWEVAKSKLQSYYKYPDKIQAFTYTTNDQNELKYTTQIASEVVRKDSLANVYIQEVMLKPLFYSNTVNPCLKNEGTPAAALDSIKSTSYNVTANTLDYKGMAFQTNDAADLFVGATKQVLSNGVAWLTDSLRFKPWQYGCPLIRLRATTGSYQPATTNTSRVQSVRISSDERNEAVEGSLHGSSYLKVTASQNQRPNVYFYVPGLMKTKYAVYLSMVPENIDDETKEPVAQTLQIKKLEHSTAGLATASSSGTLPVRKNLTGKSAVTFDYGTQDSARIVTKYMGEYEPNFCYKGLPGTPAAYPLFEVLATSKTAIPAKTKQIVLGISNIILVPMEAIDYYMQQGVITDYKDEMPELFWHLNMATY